MSGITDLRTLLCAMRPVLLDDEFVFCTVEAPLSQYLELNPVATFCEQEGLTLVLTKAVAQKAKLAFSGSYRQITLTVHSSLDGVGLTAAISATLADKGISANVIAAYYHDHIFVPSDKAQLALMSLKELSVSQ
ncbi:ACT domain-containing protein [Alteromonas sp. C1M14]|uniref:ACT domain-containing protein n=1 Tax=Alteromonas sp. C1M14 TaxID=2841567 RepID=UPI001C0A30CE|nr:ACT domain-containing protein [Alteromonas sp. C1M14]MBU2978729.1 ACT domain-containing protein [Alteromonas sp. C1M14]